LSAPDVAVRLTGVSKWYGEVLGVSGVTLDIPRGGVFGLLGPNGAGKSTLMGVISGLLAPSAGSVMVFGRDPRFSREARAGIGLCPEGDAVFPGMNCIESLVYLGRLAGLSAAVSRARSRDVLDQLGLAGFAKRELRKMSKGERQRVKLAQALLHHPDLLLLDEPLSGMDPLVRIDVTTLIRDLGAGGTTVLVSSHILSEVEAMTSRVIVVSAGKVIASGQVAEIRAMLNRHPHKIKVSCDRPAALARDLLEGPGVVGMELGEGGIVVRTTDPGQFYGFLNDAIVRVRPGVEGFSAEDHDLASVFQYLVPGQ
jgi:ABC-2 type transport system ATP-binding protein